MRLSALRKLIFGVHGEQEMFFRLAKKNSVDGLNFKTKVYIIFQSKCCALCPWSGQTSQIVIEKGKPV